MHTIKDKQNMNADMLEQSELNMLKDQKKTDGDELDTINASVYVKCSNVYGFFLSGS